MQKMMTYSEANSVLGSSLTPLNRCLSKSVAIANDADPEPLENYENNRLVPASIIEPGSHWIDEHTIEHYFVDENGNNLGTHLSITVPKDAAYYILTTKALLDGQPFPDDMKGGNTYHDDQHQDWDWVHNEGNISGSIHERYTNTNYDINWLANVSWINAGTTGHWPLPESDGTTYFVMKFKDKIEGGTTQYGTDGNFAAGIDINTDTAKQIKMDYKGSLDPWNIIANFSKDLSTNYYLSDYLIEFKRSKSIEECELHLTVSGFEEGFEVEYIGWYGLGSNLLLKNNDNKFSDCVVPSRTGYNTMSLIGIKETEPASGICYNVYKVISATNPNKFLYFLVVRKA